MIKFNTIILYVGIVLTAIGMLIGFPMIIWSNQDIGMYFVSMVTPIGFLLLFTGFIGNIALRPHSHRNKRDYEEHKKAESYQRSVPD